ncbi:MAG TPA: hypothetical protein VJ997_07630, partial [Longimicrobiales bacterium]|nr:hypothetical protein [Longimicrobiales bacterium]
MSEGGRLIAVTSIRSETPSQLTLTGVEGESLVFAPLQEKAVDDVRAFDFSAAEREGLVTLVEAAPGGLGEQLATILLGGGVWVGILGTGISSLDPPGSLTPVQWRWTVWLTGIAILAGTAGIMLIRGTNSFSLVARFTSQMVALAF